MTSYPKPKSKLRALREQVAIASDQLSDAELAAVALGVPVVQALALLEQEDCAGARGVRLKAAVELGRRVALRASLPRGTRLPDRHAVEAWAQPRLASLEHEELWALLLDGHHGLIAPVLVASGGIHGLHVAARDPVRAAIKRAASAFVLVHNHPSGDPQPSDEDVVFTRAVREAAAVVGTPLLDHVVVTRRRSCSFLDMGLMPTIARKP